MDQNVGPGDAAKSPTAIPSADVHVVTPGSLSITCLPHKTCQVLVDHEYEVLVEVFDRNNNKIYPSDNLVIKVQVCCKID